MLLYAGLRESQWHSGPPTCPRGSLGAKRNAAVAAARGELMVVADDDDYFAPSRLRTQAMNSN